MKLPFKTINRDQFFITALGIALSLLFLGFCVLTSNQGFERRYLDSDIPFVYQLNNSIPLEWIPVINTSADSWTDLESCYWVFEAGPLTATTSASQDNINLVFFDFDGVNFPPGTSTIAFSRTYTTGSGASYHARESDLVWNARDFTPSITGSAGQQDLQSVMSHEFGHHMGIGHAGPVGGPPGCGPLLTASTMYGTSSSGDTTGRTLEPDDIAAGSIIYPTMTLEGVVVDVANGLPLEGAGVITTVDGAGYYTGPVETPNGSTYERPGIVGVIPVQADGSYFAIILKNPIDLRVEYFGYQSILDQVQYLPPGGIGITQAILRDFQLQESPLATFSGTVFDSVSLDTISAVLEVVAVSNKVGTPDTVFASATTIAGGFSLDLPANENYLVTVRPALPYPTVQYMIDDLDQAGEQADFRLNPADVFLVNDDPAAESESYIQQAFDALGVTYYTWQIATSGLPESADFQAFPEPKTVFWFTGAALAEPVNELEMNLLTEFLDSGGRLLLSGQNIAESDTGSTLLQDYLQVSFDRNFSPPIMKGVEDDPVGGGLLMQTSGGPGNQASKDVLIAGTAATPVVGYGPAGTSGTAGIRIHNNPAGWKAVFLGFGIETINNTDGILDQFVDNTLNWFNILTGIGTAEPIGDIIPEVFSLDQNYPNPFNPETTIRFNVPEVSKVKLKIFNNLGQEVRQLTSKTYQPGAYQIQWDGRDSRGNVLATGMYYYQMETSKGFRNVKKMMLVK